MRPAGRTFARSLIAGLVLGILLTGVAEARTKTKHAPPAWEPDPNHPVIKQLTKQKNAFIAEYFPPFLRWSGVLITVGATWAGIAWVLRSPCRRCGSRRVRVQGRGKYAPRRCLACGVADSNF